jgi:hypothetical protein
MSAHTPGPWEIHPVNGCLIGADDTTVVYHFGENDADIALIAAAPDLLAALKRSVCDLDETGTLCPECRKTSECLKASAIAKAEQT